MRRNIFNESQRMVTIIDHSQLLLQRGNVDPQYQSKKISNDQELIQSDPISCPQNQKGNN